jgi:hypothetical protein
LLVEFGDGSVIGDNRLYEEFDWKLQHFVVKEEQLYEADIVHTFADVLKEYLFNYLVFVVACKLLRNLC